MADLLVVGAGLVGTSVGLALHGQRDVALTDSEPSNLATAVERGAGRAWDGREGAELVLLAVPPADVVTEMRRLQALDLSDMWSHTCSTQSRVQREVETHNCHPARVCGGHPMGGSERSGPAGASARLFQGRPWVICPGPGTDAEVRSAVEGLARDCGAQPMVLTALEHDRAVALVSHLPQLAASALAARLVGHPEAVGATAGPGLRDTTRIAASAPELWTQVLADNAAEVGPAVAALAADLSRVAAALADQAQGRPGSMGPVRALLEAGNAGRLLVPVKRGDHDLDFESVAVSLPDQPGQLAGLLVAAAEAGVNVEDVRVEHLAGRPRGLVELQVVAGEREQLRTALKARSWDVVD